jgi:hypothetical protein
MSESFNFNIPSRAIGKNVVLLLFLIYLHSSLFFIQRSFLFRRFLTQSTFSCCPRLKMVLQMLGVRPQSNIDQTANENISSIRRDNAFFLRCIHTGLDRH